MPVSLISAIRNKYEDQGNEISGSEVVVFVTKQAKCTVKDGLVIPPLLTLNDADINEGGDAKELCDVCKNVTELDLTDNLLTEWSEVFNILHCMPKLHFLNLSGNKLSHSLEVPAEGKAFDNITHLILNSTEIPWETVLRLLKWFPSLQELHSSLNSCKTLYLEDKEPYESLKQIFLYRNLFSDWSEVCKLGEKFPNMDQMVLFGNPFEVLMGDFSALQNLSSINVSETQLKDWEELAKFSVLENLCDLRLKPIPLTEGLTNLEARQMCISYLPNVIRLNGSTINEEERVDAERAFVRRYMDSDVKPKRFYELETKYGQLDPLPNVSMKPPSHVKVTVEYMDTKQDFHVKLRRTVAELKKDLESIAGVPSKSFRLFHTDREGWYGKVELMYLQRSCHSIPIRNGDEIEIRLR